MVGKMNVEVNGTEISGDEGASTYTLKRLEHEYQWIVIKHGISHTKYVLSPRSELLKTCLSSVC